MAQILGYNGPSNTTHTQARISNDIAYAPVLDSAQLVDTIYVRTATVGTVTLDFAIYDVTDVTTDFSSAPRVAFQAGVNFTGTGDASAATPSNDLSQIDLSAYSGRNLFAVANNVTVGAIGNGDGAFTSAARNGSATALDDPFGANFATSRGVCCWAETFTSGGTPTISNVDGDNAVNQGQLVNIDVTNFAEVITTGDIGGVAFPSIPDNDPADNVIQVRIPVTLTDGTYDVTISGATETDTISGVTYTVTHPYEAPYGQVDSNSDWTGQKLTQDSYWRVVTPFAHGTYDFTAGAAETPPFGNDINDHFTADAGYEGSDSEVRGVMYADGTTAQYTVNIEIGESGTVRVKGLTMGGRMRIKL